MQRSRQAAEQHDSANVLAHFIKNASYTESYHDKYYYPAVVRSRVAARKSQLDGRADIPDPGDINAGIDGGSAGSQQQRQVRAGSEQVSWYLSTEEQPTSASRRPVPARNGSDPEARASEGGQRLASGQDKVGPAHRNNDNNTNSGMMADREEAPCAQQDEADERTPPSTATALSGWQRVDEQTACGVGLSSESVTSEDSVFSDDYTAMTECGDCADGAGGRAETGRVGLRLSLPLEAAEDADSSFSSPGSSTGTLEADGKEDGGEVEDAGKDKVVGAPNAAGSPPLWRRSRPNIRLVLGRPVPDLDDSPPPSSDQSSEQQAGDAASQSDDSMKKSESNSFYEDREFDFLKAEPVRRSTSLKTYKTPPGTPHRKKAVRFADALGLDLESVRHILNLEEPPEVPKSAMKDLVVGLEEENRTDGVKYLSALFSQPGIDPAFLRRVQEGRVALENCIVDDKDMTISGTIRVANIAYHKSVVIRYTTNGWVSSEDVVASYVQNSNDGPTDRFSFTITVPKYFAVGQRLEFAIMYAAGGATYWDNNFGKNYVVECYARALPVSDSDNTWMHFL